MASLTREAVLKQFDKLQEEGELFYSPSEPIPFKDGDLDVSTIYPRKNTLGNILAPSRNTLQISGHIENTLNVVEHWLTSHINNCSHLDTSLCRAKPTHTPNHHDVHRQHTPN